MENNAKTIFVNHDFVFPYEELSKMQRYYLPIIEDHAHSFVLQIHNKSVVTICAYSTGGYL
jgi:dTDP-4-amino-4,6-dideoxygalactose transaminase